MCRVLWQHRDSGFGHFHLVLCPCFSVTSSVAPGCQNLADAAHPGWKIQTFPLGMAVQRPGVIFITQNHTGVALLLLVFSTESAGSGLVPAVPEGPPHSGVPKELFHLSLG